MTGFKKYKKIKGIGILCAILLILWIARYDIYVVGDSIAYGYMSPDKSYLSIIGKNNKALDISNQSRNGSYIFDAYYQLRKSPSLFKSDLIIIAVGINDLLYKENDSIRKEYWGKTIKLAKKRSDNVLVIGILPVADDISSVDNNEVIKYNEYISELCKNYDVAFYNPYPSWIKNYTSEYYIDGVHLSDVGNNKFALELTSVINQFTSLRPKTMKKSYLPGLL